MSLLEPTIIGKPLDRIDGRLKVTGKAKYAAEFLPAGCLYAFPVFSEIASGVITSIDTSNAEKLSGVRLVMTHLNRPKISDPKPGLSPRSGMRSEIRLPLKDETINYGGQYVALVIAETFEQARHGASLVKVNSNRDVAILGLAAAQAKGTHKKPKVNNGEPVQGSKGDLAAVLKNTDLVKIEHTYHTPQETHNPIEMSATVAVWNDKEHLTVYDATQFVKGVQDILAKAFDLKVDDVRVISPFVGGAFGCKGAVWPHVILTAMAAQATGAPVKFAIPRSAMFTGTGHRTATKQTITMAASKDGKLQGLRHYSETLVSTVGQHVESCGMRSSGVLYQCPAIEIEELVYPANQATPTFMRAPGECPGTYAVESAMDELAYELKIDPLTIREINHATAHPMEEKPWSTNFLLDAYKMGAEKFGWSKRSAEPGSMKDGDLLVGWGVATATYPAYKMSADAKARLRADGTAVVQSATHDLGTGAYTAFTQISAEAMGISMDKMTFELGDSRLPFGPVAGGSNSTATVGTAIYEACKGVHTQLAALASGDPSSPLHGVDPLEIIMVAPGQLAGKANPSITDGFLEIMRRAGKDDIEAQARSDRPSKKVEQSFHSFGVHFCEVKIDPMLPRVQVTRVVSVIDGGRIINAKTAHSQIIGGVVMGIGMALTEETVIDRRSGMPVIRNLADYHVPVNADIRSLEAYFVGEPDFAFTPMGSRGLGEIGNTGIAAAVANAVFHATGKRVRDLPITPDKLLA